MLYLILSGVSSFVGVSTGLGASLLLFPLLMAVSPLHPAACGVLCILCMLCASLIAAFFALAQPLPVHPDELLLLAVGSALGGFLGELASSRFTLLLQPQLLVLSGALLFVLLALPALYFTSLSADLRPVGISRVFCFAVAFIGGLLGTFLACGMQPLVLMLCFLLLDAHSDEASLAALVVSLVSALVWLLVRLIRTGFLLPVPGIMLWALGGTVLGTAAAMLPGFAPSSRRRGDRLMRVCLYTGLLVMARGALLS